jgi:hypothetical protein
MLQEGRLARACGTPKTRQDMWRKGHGDDTVRARAEHRNQRLQDPFAAFAVTKLLADQGSHFRGLAASRGRH